MVSCGPHAAGLGHLCPWGLLSRGQGHPSESSPPAHVQCFPRCTWLHAPGVSGCLPGPGFSVVTRPPLPACLPRPPPTPPSSSHAPARSPRPPLVTPPAHPAPHAHPAPPQTVRSAVALWTWCSSSTAPRALATPTSPWRRTSSSTWSTGWGPSPRTPSRRQVSGTAIGGVVRRGRGHQAAFSSRGAAGRLRSG